LELWSRERHLSPLARPLWQRERDQVSARVQRALMPECSEMSDLETLLHNCVRMSGRGKGVRDGD
ncbi:hypothetical protein NQZ68_008283, partial [Dissostichus eleginoides]